MTVTRDVVTESVRTATTDPYTFSHAGGSQPRGVILTAAQTTEQTDLITGTVSYGGVAMTRLQTNIDTTTEPGRTYIYFLGGDTVIPPGTQTVSVDLASASTTDIQFVCITLNSNNGLESIDVDGIDNDVANPNRTLNYSGREAMAFAVLFTGTNNPPGTTGMTGSTTELHNHDFGTASAEVMCQTTAGTSDFQIGYTTLTSDDVAFSACAIAERVEVTASEMATLVYGLDQNMPSYGHFDYAPFDYDEKTAIAGTMDQHVPVLATNFEYINTAEGGSDETTVTTGNSGGASGRAWDTVTIGGGGALVYDDDGGASDVFGYRLNPASAINDLVLWNTSAQDTLFARGIFRIDALPAANTFIMRLDESDASIGVAVRISSAGAIALIDSGNSVITTLAATVPLASWFKITFRATQNGGGATAGIYEINFFSDPNSTTPSETLSGTGQSLGAGGYIAARFGNIQGSGFMDPMWMDNLAIRTDDYPAVTDSVISPLTAEVIIAAHPTGSENVTAVYDWAPFDYELTTTAIRTTNEIVAQLYPAFHLENNADGGTDGALVTAGTSGGASGDAFDAVSQASGSSSLRFASISQPVSGSNVYFYRGTTSDALQLEWSTALGNSAQAGQIYWRGYFWFGNLNDATSHILVYADGDGVGANTWELIGNKMQVNPIGSAVTTGAVSIPTETWVRLEGWVLSGDGIGGVNGRMAMRLYLDPNAVVGAYDEQIGGVAAVDTNNYNANIIAYAGGTSPPFEFYLDNWGAQSTDWLGPLGTAPPATEKPSTVHKNNKLKDVLEDVFNWYPWNYEEVETSTSSGVEGPLYDELFAPPAVPITDELFPLTQGEDQNQVHALFDWAPFNYESQSAEMQAMGVEGSLAPNQSASENWETFGVEENNATHIHANATSPGGRTDNDVFVGTVSNRFSTLSATSNASYWGISGGWNPQNRIFVRFNIQVSRFPLSLRTTIFRWGVGVGPMVKIRANASIGVYNEDGTLSDILPAPLQLELMSRLEIMMERNTATTWSYRIGLAFDPTQGSVDTLLVGTATAITTATDLDMSSGPVIGNFAIGTDTWGDDGPHAIWFDDFAIATDAMPTRTGNAAATGERPSLITSAHTFDQQQFNALFDWAPFNYESQSAEMQAIGVEGSLAPNISTANEPFTGTADENADATTTIFSTNGGTPARYAAEIATGTTSMRSGGPQAYLSRVDVAAGVPQNRWFSRFNFAVSGVIPAESPNAQLIVIAFANSFGSGAVMLQGPTNTLCLYSRTGVLLDESSTIITPDTWYRLEFLAERRGTLGTYMECRIYLDPTSGGAADEVISAFDTGASDTDSLGPVIGRTSSPSSLSFVQDGYVATYYDDFAAATDAFPTPTGTAPTNLGMRASLIRNLHPQGSGDVAGQFDWAPWDYGVDHSSALDVTSTFAPAGVDGTATPDTVVGIGTVPAPTAIGDGNAAPATVAGVGSVLAPTATGTAVAAPATVVGIGSVPAPTAMGDGVATPATVAGIGSVPAPTATGEDTLTAFIVAHPSGGEHTVSYFDWFPFDYSDDHTNTLDIAWAFQYVDATATPATVAGIGSVPAPTATGAATAAPATVAGTGSVPAPTAQGNATATPATVVGTGSVPAPTAIGNATAAPTTVAGVGSVPAPTATGEDTLTAFIVAHPSGSEHTPVYFDWFPFDYSDEHTASFDIAWAFPSTGGTALPATVAGTGDVPAPTATGTATATPASVDGVGSVPAPTAQGNATATPATVVGTGSVPAPTATGTATALPAAVVGTGSVPAPTARGDALAAPGAVAGIGSVPAPTAMGNATATPSTVGATGSVPAPNATGEDTLFELYDPSRGEIASYFDWYPFNYETSDPSTSLDVTPAFFKDGTASPATVAGVGSVPAPTASGNATALPSVVAGVGTVPAPTVTGTATAAPAAVVGTGAVPAPTVTGNATAQPGVVAGIGDVPAPAASGGSVGTATPGAVQGVGGVPSPTVTGTAFTTPATISGVGDVPAPSAQGSATALPAATAGIGTVGSPTVTGTATALPDAVAGIGSVPAPTAQGNAFATPSTVAGIGDVPPATASGGSVGTATPGAVQGVGNVPAPTVTGTATALPAAVAGVGSIPAPTAAGSAIATPATVAGVGSVPAPTASGTTGATALPAAVAGVGSVPAPTVTGTAVAHPNATAGVGSVPAPNVYEAQAGVALPSAVAGVGAVGSPAATGGSRALPASVAAVLVVPAITGTGYGLAEPVTVNGVATVPAAILLVVPGFWPQTSNGNWSSSGASEWPQTNDEEWVHE